MEKMKGPFNGWPYHSKLFDTGTGQRYCQDAPIVLRCFRFWETFNSSGKTDILIRVENRNIFIAECKFWRGPKSFGEAIEQLSAC